MKISCNRLANVPPVPVYETIQKIHAARDALEAAIDGYQRPAAFGLGVATRGPSGDILDVSYPRPNVDTSSFVAAALATASGHVSGTQSYELTPEAIDSLIEIVEPAEACTDVEHPNVAAARAIRSMQDAPAPRGGGRVVVAAFIQDLDDDPVDAVDAYLRLHLLSARLVRATWRQHGRHLRQAHQRRVDEPRAVRGRRLRAAPGRNEGRRTPRPCHWDRQISPDDRLRHPSGVRIADASRVRLGAHLAEGTTVMHEGFCNFNAGTMGTSMVEGRISAGVVVGDGSDIGGGASIMGTLSGGGSEVISVGENCLIGAEGGIGISLGDDCVVEAGCYITAGTLITAPDGSVVKAKDLSGHSGLLFRRNSQTGALEALVRGESSRGRGSTRTCTTTDESAALLLSPLAAEVHAVPASGAVGCGTGPV